MNSCKEEKRKAEAPFLSSWTLCLQAELVSAGWHPLFPEQVGEDLEGDEVKGTPAEEKGDCRWEQCKISDPPTNKANPKRKHAVKQRCEKKGNSDDVSCLCAGKCQYSPQIFVS